MVTGHVDKILRVDLSARRIWTEPLPSQAILRKYVGGTGLALHYLIQECSPGAKPTDPGTPLIFMTGPLAGTRAPSSSNYVVVSLHYDIPYAVGAGFAHGFWAAFLKFAGYEGIILTGAADAPVYLLIDDDKVELRDAAPYWGLGTRETERRIKRDLDVDPTEMSVACIGQAGESLLPGAMIKNDRNHGAGKGSPGALMGAKKIKAIAVRGTGQVKIAEPQTFLEAATQWEDNLFVVSEDGKAPLGMLWHNGGMTRHHGVMAEQGLTAGKNLTDPVWSKKFSDKYMEACAEWRVDPQPSYNCTIACSYDVRIMSGPFAGSRVSLCGGGEPFEGAAAIIGVDEPGAALVMTDHFDDIGMEVGVGGSILGMAYEAYERGIITKEDTGGLELTWGNFEAAIELLDQMIEHRGFGGKLAKGMKEAAEAIGGGAEDFLVHVKGAGINMHDWRPLWGPLFGQIIAGTGPAHQIEYPMLWQSKDAASQAPTDKVPFAQAQKIWEDCTGVCMFACQGVKDITVLAPQAVARATGWKDFTTEEAMQVGERVVNMMRLLGLSRGFKKEDDFDVSPRLMEAPTEGPAAGVASMGPKLGELLEKYYEQMGWDPETGIPRRETIERLDLGDVVNRLELGAIIK
ncbi:MAG: aldehyde ferredoxin oxidoreductase C-terminal domain-containing protein [bacterium]